jgi:hypothetical protein
VVLRPALDSAELRAYTTDWASQVEDHHLLVDDARVAEVLRDVTRIGYAELRRAQQAVPSA